MPTIAPKPAPPRNFDFVLLAPTPTEARLAKQVLGLAHNEVYDGLRYSWAYIQQANNFVAVAVVSLHDIQGETQSAHKTYAVIEKLDPDYILVLGIAGGISTASHRLKTGSVVVGYYLHYGTVKKGERNPLRALRCLPPSEELFETAAQVADKPIYVEMSRKRRKVDIVLDREVLSGASLEQKIDDSTLVSLVKSYPRLAALEMEAGGMANTLWVKRGRSFRPGYLIVKGISDVHDYSAKTNKKGHTRIEKNAKQRSDWRRYAARASARFAKELILEVCRTRTDRRPTPIKRLLPDGLSPLTNVDLSGVIHKIEPEDYSKITWFNVDRILEEPGETKRIFTVCAYEPKELWDIVQRSYQSKHNNKEADLDELVRWSHEEFPHFAEFSNYAKLHPRSCVRVLVLRDEHWHTYERLYPQHWKFFRRLNGKVPCWGVLRTDIQHRVTFLTDHCVIGNKFVLDYYQDSHTLLISEIRHSGLKDELLSIKSAFDGRNKRKTSPFISPTRLTVTAARSIDQGLRKKGKRSMKR